MVKVEAATQLLCPGGRRFLPGHLGALAVALAVCGLPWQPSGALQRAGQPKQLICAMSPAGKDVSMEKMIDGVEFVHDMSDAAGSLDAYSFKYETTVFKGKRLIVQKGDFFFKKPRQIRVQMTGDYKNGAVAVLGKDGRVRGHLGGALSPFVMTVQAKSDLLLGANGYPLVDSDFASMADVVKGFIKQNMKSQVSQSPVAVEGHERKVYVLEVYKGSGGSELFKRAYIDPESLLPLEWFDYIDGHLFARTIWTNLQMNLDLKDDFFKL